MKAVKTMAAPAAIGPYSQGIVAGGFLFVSGQIPMDPASGQMIAGGIAEQTHRVLQNIQAIAEAAGADLNRVVKTTVYLKDLADFQAMNAVYAEYFSTTAPARATVQVAALPKNSAIEIDAVVCLETTGAS